MTNLSQYDPRWKDIKLGFSNLTIGQAGCLITCCSMLADTTPDKLNDRLKSVSGYADQNLLIWTKLNEATNNKLEFQWLNYVYNNDGVKQIIADEGACIVRVDNAGTMHFVLYIGNGKMVDPLTGTVQPTSKYPAQGFADIKVNETVDICQSYKDEISFKDKVIGERDAEIVTLKNGVSFKDKVIGERDLEIEQLKKQLTEKDIVVSNQTADLLKTKEDLDSVKEQLKSTTDELVAKEELRAKWYGLYQQSQETLGSCQKDRTTFQKQLTECINKGELTWGDLILKIWGKIKGQKI